ncbi:DUF805 domain-containing protein [Pseudarthrobacter sp. fls2-241-R2A-127]|uniref:DUF805 domain-containing protein n=1 Tax=Pseudarthrobacter sp. fls2-241-R2A-127 TaxID=3040303 RepID=UPI002556BB22|nr:DUF805 domain-containing protein [Pseudarthrobacter sp. fls2-241-R2A-127]
MSYPQYPQQQQQQPHAATAGGEPPLWAPYYDAPIGSAVKRFFKKYATFSGRASRSEYWWWNLVAAGVSVVLGFLLSLIPASGSDGQPIGLEAGGVLALILLGLWLLGILVPSIALTVRRLHDSNKSGWWYFISAVPFVGGIVLLIFVLLPPDPAGQQYDQPTG